MTVPVLQGVHKHRETCNPLGTCSGTASETPKRRKGRGDTASGLCQFCSSAVNYFYIITWRNTHANTSTTALVILMSILSHAMQVNGSLCPGGGGGGCSNCGVLLSATTTTAKTKRHSKRHAPFIMLQCLRPQIHHID